MSNFDNEVGKALAEHFMLEHLSDMDLQGISVLARPAKFSADKVLFHQGDPGSSMMILVRGRIKIVVQAGDGRELMLAVLGAGDILGEMALLDGRARSADAVTLEDSEVMVIERRDFLPFLRRHPDVAIHLLQVLSDRLRRTNAELGARRFFDLPVRLAQMLLDLSGYDQAKSGDGAIAVRLGLSQGNIAALIGVSRESVNKQLAEWRRSGLISLNRGTLTLHRPEDMARLAQSQT